MEIESFVKKLPITINKLLIRKEPLDQTTLDDDVREKVFSSTITPIDFLLPSVVTDYPTNIQLLQKNEKMLALGKEIRKRNFSKNLIDRLSRLAQYFAIFFYESRKTPIWRAVLDSVIKAPFTPELLLQYLDTLFRRDASEYLNFYKLISQNTRLTRIIYLIESMETETESNQTKEKSESEEIMSLPKLNNYSHHWFPGIVLATVHHPLLYKTTIEKVYDEFHNWKTRLEYSSVFRKYPFYTIEPENPQKINPLFNNIQEAILKHKKVSGKILQQEMNNPDPKIRKLVVLSPNISISILQKLQQDSDENIRKLALFKHTLMKKEKEMEKELEKENEEGTTKTKVPVSPAAISDTITEHRQTKYL